jgi:imidazoleglycerol-phosphate dehydratase
VARSATIKRNTNETNVEVTVALDGGPVTASTGVPFFDHMLDQLGSHSNIGLKVMAAGDLEIDAHHTVEDVGIALGEALTAALGDKRGIRRYGNSLVPMEESLARVGLDISGRPLLAYRAEISAAMIGQYETSLTEEFFMALCRAAGITLHIDLLEAGNAHHSVEAIFKAVAVALGTAVSIDPLAGDQIPSTKGSL